MEQAGVFQRDEVPHPANRLEIIGIQIGNLHHITYRPRLVGRRIPEGALKDCGDGWA